MAKAKKDVVTTKATEKDIVVEKKDNDSVKEPTSTKVVEKKNTTKDAEKKTPAKNAPKKTAPKKELVSRVYVQYADAEVITSELVEQVKEAWVASGHRISSVKSMDVYIKPEDKSAYYVINGKDTGKIEL